jgi:hypothetical protein
MTFCQPTVSVGVLQVFHNKHYSARAYETLTGFILQWTWNPFFCQKGMGFYVQ